LEDEQLTLFFIESILSGFKAPVASPKSVNLTCPVPSTKKFCTLSACDSHPEVVEKDSAHLWLQVSVDIPELVQLIHAHKHLCRVKAGMFLLEHARVIEQCPEISTWDILLSPVSFGLP
jgi:hypothetical protein